MIWVFKYPERSLGDVFHASNFEQGVQDKRQEQKREVQPSIAAHSVTCLTVRERIAMLQVGSPK